MKEQINKEQVKNESLNSRLFVVENELLKKKSEVDLLRQKLSKIKKLDELFLFVNEVYVCNPSTSILAINDELLVYKEAYNKMMDSYKEFKCNILKYQRLIQEMKAEIFSLKSKLKELEPEKHSAVVDHEANSPKVDQSKSEEIDINELMKSDFLGMRGVFNQDNKSSYSITGTKRTHSLNFLTSELIKRDYNQEGSSDPTTPLYQALSRHTIRSENICFETLNILNLLPQDRQKIKEFINKVNLKLLEKTKRISELEQLLEKQKLKIASVAINIGSSTPESKQLSHSQLNCKIQRDERLSQKTSYSDTSSKKGVENAIKDSVLKNISSRKIHPDEPPKIEVNKVKEASSLNLSLQEQKPFSRASSEKFHYKKEETEKKLQPSLFFGKLKDRNIKIDISESANDSKVMRMQANSTSIKNRVMSRLNLKVKEKYFKANNIILNLK